MRRFSGGFLGLYVNGMYTAQDLGASGSGSWGNKVKDGKKAIVLRTLIDNPMAGAPISKGFHPLFSQFLGSC